MAHVPVGDDIAAAAGQWTFDGLSGDAFSTHVRRSVPIYDQAHNLTLALSSFFVSGTPLMYDIGCSHGSLTFDLAANVKKFGVSVVGIDHSASLLDAARSQYEADNLSFVEADIETFEWQPSALIVSSFTLQFIRPRNRYALLRSLWQSLDWGGGLLLFEKFRAPDARFQDWMTQLYEQWKVEQGFSVEEIYNKRMSLRGILEPFSDSANLDMLSEAGFSDVLPIVRFLNFGGYLAVK